MGHEDHQDTGRKAEIYQKAMELFIEKGFDATPVSEIARAAGMSKANLYHHFANKETLLYEIHLKDLQQHFIPLFEMAEQMVDPIERIKYLLKNYALRCTVSKSAPVLVSQVRTLSQNHQTAIFKIWRRAYNIFHKAVEELQAAGKARPCRVSFTTFLGFGMVFYTLYWWDYDRQTNADEFSDCLMEIFFNGFLNDAYKNPAGPPG